MVIRMNRLLAVSLALLAACGDDASVNDGDSDSDSDDTVAPDASIDAATDAAPVGCDPATVLPAQYRLVPETSTGLVTLSASGGVQSGTIDATAGGLSGAADNPYIYVNLQTGTKVAVDDLAARTDSTWDIALKRSSLRTNSGDSGSGDRQLAVVSAESLAAVTSAPAAGYGIDDFTAADCELVTLPGGEPMSAFAEWYAYDTATHAVTPKPEVYVVARPDGTHTAFRISTYYGDPASAMRGAYYAIELKQL